MDSYGKSSPLSRSKSNDELFGNADADRLLGGSGRDILSGGIDADTLKGGDGLDRFLGGAGDDKLEGGGGPDGFYFAQNFGNDIITDFTSESDFLILEEGNEVVRRRQRGDDTVIRTEDGDTLILRDTNVQDVSVEVVDNAGNIF